MLSSLIRALRQVPRLLIVLVIAAAVTAASPSARATIRALLPSAPRVAASDTVVVYGPRRFDSPSKHATTHVERFTVVVAPGVRYLLRADNGGPGGADMAPSAEVRLNGDIVMSKDELEHTATLQKVVELQAVDTLRVSVGGKVGAYLTVRVLSVPDPSFVVFGPRTFQRTTGRPVEESVSFTAPATAGRPQFIYIANGLADGSQRVSSGEVKLNDANVTAPDDFNQQVASIVRPVTLRSGTNVLKVQLNGAPGSRLTIRLVATDTTAPTITIQAPGANSITRDSTVAVSGTVRDETATSVLVNGVAASVTTGAPGTLAFSGTARLLAEGANIITVSATDAAGRRTDSTRTVQRDTRAPTLTVSSPAEHLVTNADSVTVAGVVSDASSASANVNGLPLALGAGGAFARRVALAEGANYLTITATDTVGNSASVVRVVTRDIMPPTLTLTDPADSTVTNLTAVTARGHVTDATAVSVSVNGTPVSVAQDGNWTTQVTLGTGATAIVVEARDEAGNVSTRSRTVIRDIAPPVLNIASPADQATVNEATLVVSGSATDAHAVTVEVNEQAVVIGAGGAFADTLTLVLGANSVTVVAFDAAGNRTTVVRTVTYELATPETPMREVLGVDPALVAPALDPMRSNPVGLSTAFLYTGPNAVQTGVAPNAINPVLAGVLRGRVIDRSGNALGGVEVSVVGHPEFGRSLTRANGLYDLVSNAGGEVVLRYAKSGFLPVQRHLPLAWQEMQGVDDVVLTPLSPVATSITFTAPIEVARGPVETDASGSRRATMMFAQGTQATLVLPNGTTQPAPSLTVRATEFTVGESGPKAMPAPLPSGTEYTYAVELSADEATALGASVRFSAPVAVYVDNFLRFRPGTVVPIGVYEPAKKSWIPERSGRVIRILDIAAGQATIDANGDSLPESPASLDSLGVTPAEMQSLATLYSPGAELWRWQMSHFTIVDANMGGWNDPNLDQLTMPGPSTADRNDPGCRREECHSTIAVENQSLSESIRVQGAPFALTYTSHTGQGAVGAFSTLRIPVTGAVVPSGVRSIKVELNADGRLFEQVFEATANQTVTWTWDGKDAYGRSMSSTNVGIERLYSQAAYYSNSTDFGLGCASLNNVCSSTGVPTRDFPYVGHIRERVRLSRPAVLKTQVGGWSVSAHHFYDVAAGTLVMGDGRLVVASNVTAAGLADVAGTGKDGTAGDGGSALAATFTAISGIVQAPDGSTYVSDQESNTVRKVTRDGVITTIAGTGTAGEGAAGGAATATALNQPAGLAIAPDGSLLIADALNHRVLRHAGGILTLVAGGNGQGYAGDDSLATAAQLNEPRRIVTSGNGTLLILDKQANVVREVTADGRIRRFAGGGAGAGCAADGVPSLGACLSEVVDLAVAPDGQLIVATYWDIRSIARSGQMSIVAGGGSLLPCQDWAASVVLNAREVEICPEGIAVGRDGSIYVSEQGGEVLRVISPQGTIAPLRSCPSGIVQPTLREPLAGRVRRLQQAYGVCQFLATAADGSILVAGPNRVRRLEAALPGYSGAAYLIAAASGQEVYEFDALGRHLRTLDAMTRVVSLVFAHDAAGRLTSITDADGNATLIERRVSDGAPTAIVSPYGERTTLSIGGSGLLTSVTDPAGQAHTMTYHAGGLLATFADARGSTTHFAYDATGRLISDLGPLGGGVTLSRKITAAGDTVSLTDTFGRVHSRAAGDLDAPVLKRQGVDAAGTVSQTIERQDGVTVSSSGDGSVVETSSTEDDRFGNQLRLTKSTTVRLPNGQSATVHAGRVSQLADPADPMSLVTQTDTLVVADQTFRGVYDAAARTYTTTSPEGRSTVMTMDAAGRVIRVESGGLAPIHYTYDSRGRLATVVQGDRTETYAYNALGRLSSVTDALNRVTSFTYDAAGRLVSQSLPGGRTVAFTYDAAGNLTSLTPPGQPAHTFAFNAGNLATLAQAPAVPGSTGTTSFTYSREKELLSLMRADSAVVSLGYDAAGRANRVTSPDGQHTVTYHPTTGQVTGLSAPGGVGQAFTYTGALPTSTTWSGPVVRGTVGVTYDQALRPYELTVGGQSLWQAFYRPDGMPEYIGPVTLGYRWDNALLEAVNAGSATTTFAYDSLGQVLFSATVHDVTADTLFRQAFTYDRLGRLTGLAERVKADTATYAYGYAPAGRLAEVRTGGVVTATYTYDLNGNRTRVVTPTQTVTAAYDAQDRLLSAGSATYRHAATGERTLKIVGPDTTRTRYDAFGNLRDVYLPNDTHVEYAVDAQQRRTARLVNGVVTHRWLYQSQLAIAAEVDSAGTPVRMFNYGSHGNVPELMTLADGTQYRLVTDHLGSVRLVIDVAADTVVQRLAYDAYGRVVVDTRPGFQPFGYAGGLYDPLTGLVRFGARDYDAETGRWTAKDPAGFRGGVNAYEYGASQPQHAVDSEGEEVRILGHWAGGRGTAGLTDPPSFHLSLQLAPDEPCECNIGDVRTLGGQPSFWTMMLYAEENYPDDATGRIIGIVRPPTGMSDCTFIRALIAAARRYRPVRYSFPDGSGFMPPGEFNSNSFVSGVIRAAGGMPPTIITDGTFQVPGYTNPVPIPRPR